MKQKKYPPPLGKKGEKKKKKKKRDGGKSPLLPPGYQFDLLFGFREKKRDGEKSSSSPPPSPPPPPPPPPRYKFNPSCFTPLLQDINLPEPFSITESGGSMGDFTVVIPFSQMGRRPINFKNKYLKIGDGPGPRMSERVKKRHMQEYKMLKKIQAKEKKLAEKKKKKKKKKKAGKK